MLIALLIVATLSWSVHILLPLWWTLLPTQLRQSIRTSHPLLTQLTMILPFLQVIILYGQIWAIIQR